MKYGALYKKLKARREKLAAAADNWFETEREKIEKKYKADLEALEARRGQSSNSHAQEVVALDKMIATLEELTTPAAPAVAEVAAENKAATKAAVRATDEPPSFLQRAAQAGAA